MSERARHPPSTVSLVIPGRNAERTLATCLEAVTPMLRRGEIGEILFVDDGSTDGTASVVGRYPVKVIAGEGRGPGAARNLGWRAARGTLIWFIDSDCVAELGALSLLRLHLDDAEVVGVGGSYDNMEPDSLVACLIHEEIRERHLAMPERVDYLGSFNVLYRRAALEETGGFDEALVTGEDADLSYRLIRRGHALEIEKRSLVGHFHATRLGPYLRAQRSHGVYAVKLYLKHPGRAGGNSYAQLLDHLQPPLAAVAVASVVLIPWPILRWITVAAWVALVLAQLPMTLRLTKRTRSSRYLWFAPFGAARAVARAVGMVEGVVRATLGR